MVERGPAENLMWRREKGLSDVAFLFLLFLLMYVGEHVTGGAER